MTVAQMRTWDGVCELTANARAFTECTRLSVGDSSLKGLEAPPCKQRVPTEDAESL